MVEKQISWLLAFIWQPSYRKLYRSFQSKSSRTSRMGSVPPQRVRSSKKKSPDEFRRQLYEAQMPIRLHGDARDIYLA